MVTTDEKDSIKKNQKKCEIGGAQNGKVDFRIFSNISHLLLSCLLDFSSPIKMVPSSFLDQNGPPKDFLPPSLCLWQ